MDVLTGLVDMSAVCICW